MERKSQRCHGWVGRNSAHAATCILTPRSHRLDKLFILKRLARVRRAAQGHKNGMGHSGTSRIPSRLATAGNPFFGLVHMLAA
jgi:hypothetical protein